MTREQYLKFHEETCQKMIAVTKAKNQDYCGPQGSDPFKNFRTPEFFGFASAEQGFLTRMCDKFARVSSFVQAGVLQVKDETVEDTLIDLANYAILLAGFIRDRRESKWEGPRVAKDESEVEKERPRD